MDRERYSMGSYQILSDPFSLNHQFKFDLEFERSYNQTITMSKDRLFCLVRFYYRHDLRGRMNCS